MRCFEYGRELSADEARLVLWDWAIQRGDGCFEVLRSYRGTVFAVEEHIERMQRSAAALDLDLPDAGVLAGWVQEAGGQGGDCVVRVIVTRGNPRVDLRGRVLIFVEPLPEVPEVLELQTQAAPWHSSGSEWALAGVKSLSYAPNLAASRAAAKAGFDDAVLLSDDGVVLEGPTFSVGWFKDGTLETPSLDLWILDSITRRHVLQAAGRLGVVVSESRFGVRRLLEADEVFAMSTIKEVRPVSRVDQHHFEVGPSIVKLREAFRSLLPQES